MTNHAFGPGPITKIIDATRPYIVENVYGSGCGGYGWRQQCKQDLMKLGMAATRGNIHPDIVWQVIMFEFELGDTIF